MWSQSSLTDNTEPGEGRGGWCRARGLADPWLLPYFTTRAWVVCGEGSCEHCATSPDEAFCRSQPLEVSVPNFPADESRGFHVVPFSRTIYIEQADFREVSSSCPVPGRGTGIVWVLCMDRSIAIRYRSGGFSAWTNIQFRIGHGVKIRICSGSNWGRDWPWNLDHGLLFAVGSGVRTLGWWISLVLATLLWECLFVWRGSRRGG